MKKSVKTKKTRTPKVKKLEKAVLRLQKVDDVLRDFMEARGYRTVHGGGAPLPPYEYNEAFEALREASNAVFKIFAAERDGRFKLTETGASYQLVDKDGAFIK